MNGGSALFLQKLFIYTLQPFMLIYMASTYVFVHTTHTLLCIYIYINIYIYIYYFYVYIYIYRNICFLCRQSSDVETSLAADAWAIATLGSEKSLD